GHRHRIRGTAEEVHTTLPSKLNRLPVLNRYPRRQVNRSKHNPCLDIARQGRRLPWLPLHRHSHHKSLGGVGLSHNNLNNLKLSLAHNVYSAFPLHLPPHFG